MPSLASISSKSSKVRCFTTVMFNCQATPAVQGPVLTVGRVRLYWLPLGINVTVLFDFQATPAAHFPVLTVGRVRL